jgi:hypothetical protein
MNKSTLFSLTLAAGFLISGNAHSAVMAPSLGKQSLVQKAGDWEYCYWKQKDNGKWKLKCDD